ncbi:Wzz/FepE/Etk N-terminal domain-containing protein [Janthinobacterium sp. 78]|jgi:tyrosine-protein kinase Etk/Wzc|uniref:GumC family protein n=1 Tax=Janthinobacterium sp. 78 TaxID=2135631 RepID=UPI000E31390C|nr:Wzz/FepE/Etk N-terminal domain-containing protein [Janthinobacterium sp. 78]
MSEQQRSNSQANDAASMDDQIHPLDLLIVLVSRKKMIIGMAIGTGLVAMAVSLMIPPTFTSTAKIMPPQQQQSSGMSAMLGQLGGLAGTAGSLAGIKNPNDLYVGLLESRTIADKLIERFKLKSRYEKATMDDTRNTLSGFSNIANGKKDGLISISVEDSDPKIAAEMANAYVEELAKLTQTMAITESSQRRLFFEKQLKDAKEQLAKAEIALRATQEKTGLIQLDGQVQAIIGNVAQLKGAIAAKEIQLNAMRTFAAPQNPELLRSQEELRGMQVQLSKLERSRTGNGDLMVPTGSIPEVGVEYVRSLRDVKYYETVFELLAKQFELAKIDEAKDSSLIQVLDEAIPAERKSAPLRGLITLIAVAVGGVLGIVMAFASAIYTESRRSSESRERWEKLSSVWKNSTRKGKVGN